MRPSFIHHLHPPTIPALQARFRYTLAAGGLAVFLALVLLITGLLEMFFYVPTPDQAAVSIQTLTFLVPYGGFIRNMHFWSAQFLVIVTLLHLLRVIFTGAYLPPRRFNYLLGMGLLVLAVFLDFSGYILRWDEGIHWALVTGTNLVRSIPLLGEPLYILLVGGSQIGPATLTRFYGWHIAGLTLLAGFFLVWHIFRLRRDGGIALPPPLLRADQVRISRHELVRREILGILFALSALVLVSVFFPAPLAAPISTSSPQADSIPAPWFFLWVQQMLKLGSPFAWGVVVPLAVLLVISLIPYIFPKPHPSELGRWFPRSNRLAQGVALVLLLAVILLSLLTFIPAP